MLWLVWVFACKCQMQPFGYSFGSTLSNCSRSISLVPWTYLIRFGVYALYIQQYLGTGRQYVLSFPLFLVSPLELLEWEDLCYLRSRIFFHGDFVGKNEVVISDPFFWVDWIWMFGNMTCWTTSFSQVFRDKKKDDAAIILNRISVWALKLCMK